MALVFIFLSQFEQNAPGQRVCFARKAATVFSFGEEFIRIGHNSQNVEWPLVPGCTLKPSGLAAVCLMWRGR